MSVSLSNRFAGFVGSKGNPGFVHKVINLIPRHQVMIEVFAGTARVSRAIRPCGETILIDKVRHAETLAAAREIPGAVFVQGDGIGFMDKYRFKGHEVSYWDPPYLLEARAQRGREYYAEEMQRVDHVRMLRVAKAINSRVIISGYHSPLYDDELSDWHTREFQVMTRGGKMATEVLWWNYPAPTELHDYRYVGDDWHARTRLRKKIARAVADLVSMPPLERGAMFEAMAAAMRSRPSPISDGRTAPAGSPVVAR